jgi:RNA polymerase sigma-70 factor (ECF subfamily)
VGIPVEWTADTNAPPELAVAADPDHDARFAELAERHARFMFKVAHGLLRNPHDAEDAVQETLLKLYRTGAWLHMEDEKAFLARTVWRAALNVAAHRPCSTADESGESELTSTASTPEQLAAAGDERALLRELIHRLPDDLRQPLILCAIKEMNSHEVAEVLGLTDGAVRTRVMRARAELKHRFEVMQRSRIIRSQEKTQ